VPGAGIEPARLAAGDFESPASTNFTTRATHQAYKYSRALIFLPAAEPCKPVYLNVHLPRKNQTLP